MDKSLQIKLSPRIQEIVSFAFQNPNLNYTELSTHFNVSPQRISQIMHNERVLNAFPVLARRRIKSMIPKAINRLDYLMNQSDNMAVSEKVVSKILDSEKVLEPSPQKHIYELQFKSVEELQAIILNASSLPSAAIDAEIVSEPEDKGLGA